jgi:hypothetical protein
MLPTRRSRSNSSNSNSSSNGLEDVPLTLINLKNYLRTVTTVQLRVPFGKGAGQFHAISPSKGHFFYFSKDFPVLSHFQLAKYHPTWNFDEILRLMELDKIPGIRRITDDEAAVLKADFLQEIKTFVIANVDSAHKFPVFHTHKALTDRVWYLWSTKQEGYYKKLFVFKEK